MIREAFGYGQWIFILIALILVVYTWTKGSEDKRWKGFSIFLFLLTIAAAVVMYSDAKKTINESNENNVGSTGRNINSGIGSI